LDQFAIELRVCVELGAVDCLVVAGNAYMGCKLRKRIQLPVPDPIKEFVEFFSLARILFCSGRTGIGRGQPHHSRNH